MFQARTVAVILNVHLPYDRKIIRGIASYMKNVGCWSLYVESDPLRKLPDLDKWRGDGLTIDFDDRRATRTCMAILIRKHTGLSPAEYRSNTHTGSAYGDAKPGFANV